MTTPSHRHAPRTGRPSGGRAAAGQPAAVPASAPAFDASPPPPPPPVGHAETWVEHRVRFTERHAKRATAHVYGVYREEADARRAAQRLAARGGAYDIVIVAVRVSSEVVRVEPFGDAVPTG